MSDSDSESEIEEEKIKIIYNGIEKIIDTPEGYRELLEAFLKTFKTDKDKEYIFFYMDNGKENIIEKDLTVSDFYNIDKVFVKESQKEIENETVEEFIEELQNDQLSDQSDDESQEIYEEKIKIIYNGLEKIIDTPEGYMELLEAFLKAFKADKDKEYIFFYMDNGKENIIEKDLTFSDFSNIDKVFVKNKEKKEIYGNIFDYKINQEKKEENQNEENDINIKKETIENKIDNKVNEYNPLVEDNINQQPENNLFQIEQEKSQKKSCFLKENIPLINNQKEKEDNINQINNPFDQNLDIDNNDKINHIVEKEINGDILYKKNNINKEEKKENDLENKLNEEKKQNNILNNKINILTKELEDEKIKNANLNNINIDLTSQLNNVYKTIKNLSDKINSINLKNDELQKIINIKTDEINILKSKLNNNSLQNFNPGDTILAIGFTSCDQKINNFILPCKDSELFVRIEEKLYNEYPEYKEKETYFMVDGSKIKRFKTLKENNIKSGNIIMLNIFEE